MTTEGIHSQEGTQLVKAQWELEEWLAKEGEGAESGVEDDDDDEEGKDDTMEEMGEE